MCTKRGRPGWSGYSKVCTCEVSLFRCNKGGKQLCVGGEDRAEGRANAAKPKVTGKHDKAYGSV